MAKEFCLLNRLLDIVKKLLIFKEPREQETFILKENETERVTDLESRSKDKAEDDNKEHSDSKNRDNKETDDSDKDEKDKNDKHVKAVSVRQLVNEDANRFKPKDIEGKKERKDSEEKGKDKSDFSKDIEENLSIVRRYFSVPKSSDVLIREFKINIKDKNVSAFVLFIDGLISKELINTNILQPLMILSGIDNNSDEEDVYEYVKNNLYTINQKKYYSLSKMMTETKISFKLRFQRTGNGGNRHLRGYAMITPEFLYRSLSRYEREDTRYNIGV
jgi:hypothetical protein